MAKVTFRGKITAEIDLEGEPSLLAAAQLANAALVHRCGGHARCGSCLVTVEEGGDQLSPAGPAETRVLRILKARPGQRLGCQAKARGSVNCRVD